MVSSVPSFSLDACTGTFLKGRRIVTGRIIKLHQEKGYGFITSEDVDSNVFFHAKALAYRQFSQLAVGYPVTFRLERTEKGLRGVDVAVQ